MHYDRYMEGMSKSIRLMSKWLFGGGEEFVRITLGKKVEDKDKHPSTMFLFMLEAMKSGAIEPFKDKDDGEAMLRAGMYSMVSKMVDGGKTTMAEILTSHDIGVLQRYFHDNVNESASMGVNHSFRYAYHVKMFEREGKRIYRVSPGLSDQLNHTLLKGLRCKDLRLPYPSLYVECPQVPAFKIWHNLTGWHDFEGAYLSEDRLYFDCGDRDEKANPITSVKDVTGMLGEGRVINVMFTAPGKHGAHHMDDAVFSFSVRLEDEVPLDDQIDYAATRFGLDIGEHNSRTNWRTIFRWLVNVMIYATWPDCEREHVWSNPTAQKLWNKLKTAKGKKASRLQRQLNACDSRRVIYLGGSIKIDRTSAVGDGDGGSGSHLLVRQRISGHWKNQAHGTNRSLRKLIWVNPYWRGPEDGPIKEAVHELSSGA